MAFSHCNLSFVLLLAIVSFPSSALSPSTTDLIDRTCKLTPFYDLCILTLLNDPQTPSADTLCNIQGMISRSPPESEQPLTYCAELYIPIIKCILPQSIEGLEKGRQGFAMYGISDTEKGIEERGGGEEAWNEVVRELATSGNHQSVIA